MENEYMYTGNDLKAAIKVYKKFKLPCALAAKYVITKDHVMLIHNAKINHEYPVAIRDGMLSGLKAKRLYPVTFDENSVDVDGFTIPAFPIDKLEFNQKTWHNVCVELIDKPIKACIDTSSVLMVCKSARKDEGIRFSLKDSVMTVSAVNTGTEISIPCKYPIEYESSVVLPNEHLKAVLSMARINSSMTIRMTDDYPALIGISIYDTDWEFLIAPRIEND